MKKSFKWAGFLVALGFLSLSATASAAIINFSFSNTGTVSDIDLCGNKCLLVTTSGTAEETSGLPGLNEWSFSGVMRFTSDGGMSLDGNGTGPGLGWSFTDTSGNNNLYGSFSSDLTTFLLLASIGSVDYSIAGGSGLFAGATGFGNSVITFLGNNYFETGLMHVLTPVTALTSVPEPGMTSLLVASLGMMGFMVYRRRRALPLKK